MNTRTTTVCILVGALPACAGERVGPFEASDWVNPDRLDACDSAYRIWEVPWDAAASDGWESPDELLQGFGPSFDIEATWSASDLAEDPGLAQVTLWRITLERHGTLPPLWASTETTETSCPDMVVVPLAVQAETADGQVLLLDSGARWGSGSWKGNAYAPWKGWEHAVLVATPGGERLGLRVIPSLDVPKDRVVMSEALWSRSMERSSLALDLSSGEYCLGLDLWFGGSTDAGFMSLSQSALEEGGGLYSWGFASGLYTGAQR